MFKVLAHGATHVGRERKNNEDSFRVDSETGLFLVCDGMGGHASGEVASQIAADAMVRFVSTDRFRPDFRWPTEALHQLTEEGRCLDAAVRMANVEVYAAALGEPAHKGMGTTIVAVLAGQHRLGLVHVGDSRIYRLRGDEFEQVTDDHSLLNHYMRTRPMSAQQIRAFAGKNVIVRAVGLRDAVDPDVQTQEYRHGDLYLLCSDGLTDMVEDAQIAEVLVAEREDLEKAGQQLIDLALEAGGKDNVTLLLLRVVAEQRTAREREARRPTEPVRQDDTSPGFDIRSEGEHLDAETLPEIAIPVVPKQFARTQPTPGRAAEPTDPIDAHTRLRASRESQRLKDTDRYPKISDEDVVRGLTPSEENTEPLGHEVQAQGRAAARVRDQSDERAALRQTFVDHPGRLPRPTPASARVLVDAVAETQDTEPLLTETTEDMPIPVVSAVAGEPKDT